MNAARWPSLVLVEGLPGSGKSTTSQWLAHEIAKSGRAAQWVYEQQTPHPVLGASAPPSTSWKEVLTHRLESWARFVRDLRISAGTTVIDSTFLQMSIFSTLRRGLDRDTILTFVDRLADVVRPLDPVLVYFREREADAALRRICDRRGMAWTLQHISLCDGSAWSRARGLTGLDGLLAYWREHAEICDAASLRCGLAGVIVDEPDGDWQARRRVIARAFGFTWPPEAAPTVVDPSRFVGRYRGDNAREARLTIHDDALVLDGLLWFRNRLLPRAPTVFDAESWPFRLSFEAGSDGAMTRFRVDGPGLPGVRVAGTYERVDR